MRAGFCERGGQPLHDRLGHIATRKEFGPERFYRGQIALGQAQLDQHRTGHQRAIIPILGQFAFQLRVPRQPLGLAFHEVKITDKQLGIVPSHPAQTPQLACNYRAILGRAQQLD